MARLPPEVGFLAVALALLAGCNASTYQLIPKSARWEVAPPLPEPSVPMPIETSWHLTTGFDRAFAGSSNFRFASSGQNLAPNDFPLLVDSNALFGSFGVENLPGDGIPLSFHLRLSAWNSAGCGELGATFRGEGFAIQPSLGLELLETNQVVVDSIVTIHKPDMEPAWTATSSEKKEKTTFKLAPMISLSIARTEGKILPWMAATAEYRNSLAGSHPDQNQTSSSAQEVGYSASGGVVQTLVGLRYRPIPPLILNAKVGRSYWVGDFHRSSTQAGFSLTFTR